MIDKIANDPLEDAKRKVIFPLLQEGKIKKIFNIINGNKNYAWVDKDFYFALILKTIQQHPFESGKDIVEQLLSFKTLSDQYKNKYFIKEVITSAAILGEKEYVKHLLNNYAYRGFYQNTVNDACCLAAALNGSSMVKFLLTDKTLYQNANIKAQKGRILGEFARYENREMIQYLTKSPELKEHLEINALEDQIIKTICFKENIDILDEILEYPEYKNIFIHDKKNALLNKIYDTNPQTLIYILMTRDIEIKKDMYCYLKHKPELIDYVNSLKLYDRLNNIKDIVKQKKLKKKI